MLFKTPAGEAAFMACYDAALAQWPVPYTSLRVPTGFGTTHVLVSGPEDGPSLVLLHAAGTGSPVWVRNVDAVSRTYRTYLVDIVGDANKSEWSSPLRSRAECAGWVADVLDGLKLDHTHLGGISFGGWHSLNFALAFPARVKSLMLIAPGASLAKMRVSFFFSFIVPALFPTRALMNRVFKWLSATGQVVDERLAEQMFLAIKHFRFPKGGTFPNVFSDEELRGVRPPTLLLIGDHEVIYDPAVALNRAKNLIPGIRTEMIANAGHLVVMEQPDIVNRHMLAFLESTDR